MTPRVVAIHEAVLDSNDRIAKSNRALFDKAGTFVINVMSAPGSGKTEFLARTLTETALWGGPTSRSPISIAGSNKLSMAVIVGDIATDNDARRLSVTGAEVVQITTGGYCHLDASMIAQAMSGMDLTRLDVLIIENVGNMVCPATFDLGEHARIALLSVTEGEDKPLKYPVLFKCADVVVLNKVDIADAVEFDRQEALANIRGVAPQATIFEVSARTGRGMHEWYDYLRARVRLKDAEAAYAA
jgi:hydrogenase nickel incorporation protein HypB